jgi:DNA-binding transcriptional MerR regulator
MMTSEFDDREPSDEHRFRIGTVAKMTGIPPATLRTWERRYEVVEPSRSDNGERMYSLEDVTRLRLLREGSDAGRRIGELADMDNEEIRQFVEDRQPRPTTPSEPDESDEPVAVKPEPGTVSVAVVAQSLPEQLATSELPAEIELSAIAHGTDTLEKRGKQLDVDIVLVELSLLGDAPATAIRRCSRAVGARGVVVLFDFAPVHVMESILATGARMVQTPVRLPILYQQIRDLAALSRGADDGSPDGPRLELLPAPGDNARMPARRFRDDQLARLREMTSAVECECPNHLASLVSALLGFENYSRNCESKNAEDAALHRRLASGTGRAREIVEELLVQVCIQDGIDF